MRLAWLCWLEDDEDPIVVFTDPEGVRYRYVRIVPIVYAEIVQ